MAVMTRPIILTICWRTLELWSSSGSDITVVVQCSNVHSQWKPALLLLGQNRSELGKSCEKSFPFQLQTWQDVTKFWPLSRSVLLLSGHYLVIILSDFCLKLLPSAYFRFFLVNFWLITYQFHCTIIHNYSGLFWVFLVLSSIHCICQKWI